MKRHILWVCVSLAGLGFLLWPRLTQPRDSGGAADQQPSTDSAATPNTPSVVEMAANDVDGFTMLGSEQQPPHADVLFIEQIFELYHRATGSMPPGFGHREIVAELAKPIPPSNRSLLPDDFRSHLSEGDWLDRWGTPYFFHKLSASQIQVVSAGPDKQLWTKDDVRSVDPSLPSLPSISQAAADSPP